MITAEQWEVLEPFRKNIELEYNRSVVGKPERLPAYDDTIKVLREAMERYGIDLEDPEQVYYSVSGIIAALSFVSQYFAVVCTDQHMMGHLSEASVFLGYLCREMCFAPGAPVVTA